MAQRWFSFEEVSWFDKPPLREAAARPLAARLGLLATGLYLFFGGESFYNSLETRWQPTLLLLSFLLYALAFALCWLGAAGGNPTRYQALIPAALIVAVLAAYVLETDQLQSDYSATDAYLFSDYAAHLLRLGENPYAWDLTAAHTVYAAPTYYGTPQINGEYVTRLAYPPLHFLGLAALQALGVAETRLLYALFWIGCLLLLYRAAPPSLKGLVLLPLLANPTFFDFAVTAVTDYGWVFLLLLMITLWQKPTARAICFGLACAYKQQPWLLLPFLLLRFWLEGPEERRWRPVAHFAGAAGLTFLAVNAPFMLGNGRSWRQGVGRLLQTEEFYFGPGLSAVTQFGLLPLPRGFYLVASLIVAALLLLLYRRYFPQGRELIWLFPGLILWFSYRGIQNYFIYWLPVVMTAVWTIGKMQHAEGGARNGGSAFAVSGIFSKKRSYAVLATAVLGMLLAGWYFARAASPASVTITEMNGRSLAQIDQMTVQATNSGSQPMTPRFFLQSGADQPYPWQIEAGPESLPPGDSGIYQIQTDLPYRMLNHAEGATLHVADAGGAYRLSGRAAVPPDFSLTGFDWLFNRRYRSLGNIPQGWTPAATAAGVTQFTSRQTPAGLSTVEITWTPPETSAAWASAGLSQEIAFPTGDLSLWVQPPAAAGAPEAAALVYGLAFSDGARTAWVLFGPEAAAGFVGDDHYYRVIAAPPDEWSQRSFNLEVIYAEAGWPLPALRRRVWGHQELWIRPLTVQLLLAARGEGGETAVTAAFGPLNQDMEAAVAQRIKRLARR
jgi:hypothetical protein